LHVFAPPVRGAKLRCGRRNGNADREGAGFRRSERFQFGGV
jgi:hypothetical protein